MKKKSHIDTAALVSQINAAAAMIANAGRSGKASWIITNSAFGSTFGELTREHARLAKIAERSSKIDNLLADDNN